VLVLLLVYDDATNDRSRMSGALGGLVGLAEAGAADALGSTRLGLVAIWRKRDTFPIWRSDSAPRNRVRLGPCQKLPHGLPLFVLGRSDWLAREFCSCACADPHISVWRVFSASKATAPPLRRCC